MEKELERLRAENKALLDRLSALEVQARLYFEQKQTNGRIVGELRSKLQRIRALTPTCVNYSANITAILDE